jgi:hypothetical protein
MPIANGTLRHNSTAMRPPGASMPEFIGGWLRTTLIAIVGIHLLSQAALAQNTSFFAASPIVGGTRGLAPPKGQPDFGGRQPAQHRSPTGTPCVSVNGLSQAQIVNPNIYEHILIIENICSQPIGLKVCYFQSTSCVRTIISGYARRQQNLGVAPNAKDFRYSYTEEFN